MEIMCVETVNIENGSTNNISIVISVLAFFASIIAIYIAYNANQIEKKRDELELEQGKTALLNLTARYFVANLQRTKFVGTKFSVNTDKYYTANYIEELELIALQFDNLITSTYYTLLFKKFAIISLLSISIRKEIMFIKMNNEKGEAYGFDNVVWKRMLTVLTTLKKRYKNCR